MLKNPALRTPLAISFGAMAGVLSRYYLGAWFAQLFGIAIPYGTIFINVSGCFLLGFFATLSLGRIITIHSRLPSIKSPSKRFPKTKLRRSPY